LPYLDGLLGNCTIRCKSGACRPDLWDRGDKSGAVGAVFNHRRDIFLLWGHFLLTALAGGLKIPDGESRERATFESFIAKPLLFRAYN
jgi:hypothetical protein